MKNIHYTFHQITIIINQNQKTMKTIKTLFIAISTVVAVTLFSCDDETVTTTGTENEPGELIKGHFTLSNGSSYEGSDESEVKMRMNMKGDGDLNQFGAASLNLEHLKIIDFANNKVHIIDGNFIIRNESGSELFGSTGSQVLDGGTEGSEYTLNGSISGGTGRFEGVRGYLTISLQNQFNGQVTATIQARVYNLDENPTIL